MKYFYAILIFVLVVFSVYTIYTTVPDYSHRGSLVIIAGTTRGFLLKEDRYSFLRKRYYSTVLYPDSRGQWHEQEFPTDIVKPFTIKFP